MKKYLVALLCIFLSITTASAQKPTDKTKNLYATVGVSFTLDPAADLGIAAEYVWGPVESYTISDASYCTITRVLKKGWQDYETYPVYTLKTKKTGSFTFTQKINHCYPRYSGNATMTYNITSVDVTKINLGATTLSLFLGDTYTFSPIITHSKATTTLTWKSSNTAVATISNKGVLTTKGVGKTTITCTASNGVSASCTVTVNPILAKGISLNYTSYTLLKNGTFKLKATVTPSNTTDKSVTWKSSNEEVAIVSSDGTVTGITSGTCNIIATTADGSQKSATCIVTVVDVTSIIIPETLSLMPRETYTFEPTIVDSRATTTLKWESSNTAIATITEGGALTAVSFGSATITCTAHNGVSAQCVVTVSNGIMAANILGCQSSRVALPILMANTKNIAGFQFELVLPEGVTVKEYRTSERTASHSITLKELTNGAIRFVVASMTNKLVTGTEGAVVYIVLNIDKNTAVGDHSIQLTNVQLTEKNDTELKTIDTPDQSSTLTITESTLGDVNNDGRINVTDVIAIIAHILEDTPGWFVEAAADLNGDGQVNVTDAVAAIQMALEESGE